MNYVRWFAQILALSGLLQDRISIVHGIPGYLAIGFWLVGFFWGTAALCYFFGGTTDLIFSLLALGLLSALAKWIIGQRGDK